MARSGGCVAAPHVVKTRVVGPCFRCGGDMVEREAAVIIVVACSRKCGAIYTKKKGGDRGRTVQG